VLPSSKHAASNEGRVSVNWARVVTDWQTNTIALVGIALQCVAAALYTLGVVRLRRGGRPWPPGRSVCFGLGLLSLAMVLQSGFAGYDDDVLWVHMTQHLVLMMLAAPLLALGAPVRLCLAAGSPAVRRFVAGILHDPSMRVVTGMTAAVLVPLDYYGSMAVYLLTPLYRLSERNPGFHEFVHVYFLTCGLMFWVPILGRDPASWRPSPRLKLWLVTAGVPIYMAIAGAMYAEGSFITPEHSLADIHRGAIAMLVGGIALTLAGDALLIRNNRQRRVAVEQRNVERRLALVARS
jgi:cytochrome c oxidase assembly factor CtaG